MHVFLVEADYPRHGGGRWTWRRRYLSKQAAVRQAERRRKGFGLDAVTWDDDDLIVEPALEVRLSVATIGEWVAL